MPKKAAKKPVTQEAFISKKKKKNMKPKKDLICDRFKPSLSHVESDIITETYKPSEGLFEENDIGGKHIFQFAHNKIKETEYKTNLITKKFKPKKTIVNGKVKQSVTIPSSKNEVDTSNEISSRSKRYNLRQNMRDELLRIENEDAGSDLEDSDNDSWIEETDFEDDDPFYATNEMLKKSKTSTTNLAEEYFLAHKKSKITTSNHTLSNVKLNQTNIQELSTLLKSIPEYHKKEKIELINYYHTLFKKWIYLLRENFNILLYGVGSKHELINSFCKKYLEDSLYVVVSGFFPVLNIKQILNTITCEALGSEETFSNIYDHVDYIKNLISENQEDLYIIIHSMDGVTLRSMKTQTIFALLATSSRIHFIASVDAINCPLIWDQIMLSQFKWLWFDVTTFEPYIMETSYENSLLKDQSCHHQLSSLLCVYRSLTPNSRKTFLILAKYQKEAKEDASYLGIAFQEWYQICREEYLVNSDLTMQAQISEFKNHKLLSSRKSSDGNEYWYIPVDSNTLEQFLESNE